MKTYKPIFVIATGLFLLIFAFIFSPFPIVVQHAKTTTPKPQIIDSTLEYLRYSVELSQILQEKFPNPQLAGFARDIERENQKYTRNLVALIIEKGWKAEYSLPDHLRVNIRQTQIHSNSEAGDFYFKELQHQIKQLQALHECNYSQEPTPSLDHALVQDILHQQLQFSEDIEEIVEIRMQQAFND